MRVRDDITKEALEECARQGMTILDMAVELNASYNTISTKLKKYGIQLQNQGKPKKYDKEKVIFYMQQGMTNKQIAEQLDSTEKNSLTLDFISPVG